MASSRAKGLMGVGVIDKACHCDKTLYSRQS